MFADGEHVGVGHGVRGQDVQKSEQAAMTGIEALDFGGRRTVLLLDELEPPVVTAIDERQRPVWRIEPAPIQPLQQLLKVAVDGNRLGLVDDTRARTEARDEHTSPTSVRMRQPAFDRHEAARGCAWC